MHARTFAALGLTGPILAFAAAIGHDPIVAPPADPPAIHTLGRPARHAPIHVATLDAHGMPFPDRTRPSSFDVAAENAKCATCHVDIADEWRASLHRASATDPAYRRSFAIEPLSFCRSCHAPEAADDTVPDLDARTELGTGCVTCHVVEKDVLATTAHTSNAPHPVTRDPRFATAAACASCHEFPFPPESVGGHVPMQSTISEHAASPFAAVSCATCHMPTVAGHRSHLFAASRDPKMLRAAVSIVACRPSADSVKIVLKTAHVGHAFPTGDLFRRLSVTVDAAGASATRYVDRHLPTDAHDGFLDERVGMDGPLELWFATGGIDASTSVQWRVVYERVEHPTSNDPKTALLEGIVPIAGGALSIGACE